MEAKLYKGFTAVMYLGTFVFYSINQSRITFNNWNFSIRNEATSKRLLGTEYVYIQ